MSLFLAAVSVALAAEPTLDNHRVTAGVEAFGLFTDGRQVEVGYERNRLRGAFSWGSFGELWLTPDGFEVTNNWAELTGTAYVFQPQSRPGGFHAGLNATYYTDVEMRPVDEADNVLATENADKDCRRAAQPARPAFAQRVESWQQAAGVSHKNAVQLRILQDCAESRAILDAIESPPLQTADTPEGAWPALHADVLAARVRSRRAPPSPSCPGSACRSASPPQRRGTDTHSKYGIQRSQLAAWRP